MEEKFKELEIKTTEEILEYYDNYCLKGTTPLKVLDEFVEREWTSSKSLRKWISTQKETPELIELWNRLTI